MNLLEQMLASLARDPVVGYADGGAPATEPTALAALALAAHNHWEAALEAGEWLRRQQSHRGSLGISPDQGEPCWPTGWAIMVWSALKTYQPDRIDDAHRNRAVEWLLSVQGRTWAPTTELGHNTTLIGWSWVEGTHAWIEPTAINLLALQHAGHRQHRRAQEAVALLLDRQLPGGGCNYGNTSVLGQMTLPHVQPTALTLLALRGYSDVWKKLTESIQFLERRWPMIRGTASLSFASMALAAYAKRPSDLEARLAKEWEDSSYEKTPYLRTLACLALALPAQPLLANGLADPDAALLIRSVDPLPEK